jgi:zinc/manganese transport system substrate-binding protein
VRHRWLIALGLGLSLVACDTTSNEPGDGLVIVATTSVLGDIASSVASDEATVEVLIPIGVDAHDFSPSAQQAGLIANADLVVANGLGLEAGLGDVLQAAAENGVEVLEVAPMVDPIPLQGDEGSPDPHFWMDPHRAGEAGRVVAEALSAMDPGGWQARADAYADEMERTDATISESLSAIPDSERTMVTSHESFGYFGDRYGFEILGVIIPGGSTLAEPSSAHLADLVDVMTETGSTVIFAEATEPTALAEAIASELGGEAHVVELYTESLGEPGSEADTLSGMLIANASRISEALS